jgi:hypothetical protein
MCRGRKQSFQVAYCSPGYWCGKFHECLSGFWVDDGQTFRNPVRKGLPPIRALSRGGSTSNAEYGYFDESHCVQFDGLRVIAVLALLSTTIWAVEVNQPNMS